MMLALIGYIVIFMAVDYGRKEDSKISFLSWKGLIIFCLVVLGTILVREGHQKDEPKPRIHIEKEYNPTPSFQQTYLVE